MTSRTTARMPPPLSDGELRRRLSAFPGHTNLPPITPSTRSILVNKLAKLEQQQQQKGK